MRRRALLALGASALAGCDGCSGSAPSPAPRAPAAPSSTAAQRERWREIAFAPSESYTEPELATLLVVERAPVLVALHGRGEAGRGLQVGARGWRDDYHLDRAVARLAAPPLDSEDLLGFVRPERLAALNASLAEAPYRGLAVACPYTPVLSDRSADGALGFARFVTEVLLPRARLEVGSEPHVARAGIDGVSMGGRLALLVGLQNPQVFGAVAALQPAISAGEAPWLSALAARAMQKAPLRLRLVTSDDDPFRGAVLALSARLGDEGVEHDLLVTPGPHDYDYNRGPGAIEMLLWHDRVLHGLPPP